MSISNWITIVQKIAIKRLEWSFSFIFTVKSVNFRFIYVWIFSKSKLLFYFLHFDLYLYANSRIIEVKSNHLNFPNDTEFLMIALIKIKTESQYKSEYWLKMWNFKCYAWNKWVSVKVISSAISPYFQVDRWKSCKRSTMTFIWGWCWKICSKSNCFTLPHA